MLLRSIQNITSYIFTILLYVNKNRWVSLREHRNAFVISQAEIRSNIHFANNLILQRKQASSITVDYLPK